MFCFRTIALVVGLSVIGGAAAQNKQKFTISKEEQEIIDLTNRARVEAKLPPLKPHPLLFKSARAHAANMARQKKLEHVLDGKTPADRIDAAKYDYLECGENLADWEKLGPKVIVTGWLKSPVHRKEIMTKIFDEIGIGIVKIGNGKYYYVQHFGKRRTKPK